MGKSTEDYTIKHITQANSFSVGIFAGCWEGICQGTFYLSIIVLLKAEDFRKRMRD